MIKKESGRFWALLPLITFLVTYLATSIILNDFYKMPILVAFLFSAIIGFILYPKLSFARKSESFSKGAGDSGIMLMILIFLLAGAFAELSKTIGAVQSTINFALSYLSPGLLIVGLFLIACFISLSLGTSVGTVVALAPIAVGLNETLSGSLAINLAAVVGGAMFGDNLSMISDTTIAATRTQGVEMRDKFRINLMIVLPAAIVTAVIYAFSNNLAHAANNVTYEYSILKISPYVFVFLAALLGMNVIWVLISGITLSLLIGLYYDLEFWSALGAINSGMASMFELSIICILIGGIVGLIQYYGGIDFIIHHVSRKIKNARGGELGIFSLTALVNIALANNTITILIVGPLAKTIADKNNIDPKRSASILDTTSCFIQGLLPYGAQLLAAVAVSANQVTAFEIMQYLYYPYLIGLSTLLFISFRKQKSNPLLSTPN
ncbi:MAG: Na+/H+ antiporter NhaC family protein [Cyclobacteriaceae bacterium]|nr:Na+/H+ antiporter NhaC family protein [Cyclobacteriaceae bacterium]